MAKPNYSFEKRQKELAKKKKKEEKRLKKIDQGTGEADVTQPSIVKGQEVSSEVDS